LVTGASGLLGSWLVRRLVERGADVVCLVRDWAPQSEVVVSGLLSRVRVVRGDVRDSLLLERVLGEYEVDSVFHLAAQTIVGIANANPLSTFETNIGGTWAVLEACRRSPKVRAIVCASSDKAYGSSHGSAYTEDMPLRGIHPYDVSKSCADLLAASYAQSFGSPVVITRCGNLFGGGDLNWNRLVPGTIRSVLKGQRPVIRSDGQYVRDYLYVEDAADAYTCAAHAVATRPELAGEAFNFANDERLTVLQIVERILKQMRSDLEPVVRNEALNEIRLQTMSSAKAKHRLGWSPRFDMAEGLERTIAWYTQHVRRQRDERVS